VGGGGWILDWLKCFIMKICDILRFSFDFSLLFAVAQVVDVDCLSIEDRDSELGTRNSGFGDKSPSVLWGIRIGITTLECRARSENLLVTVPKPLIAQPPISIFHFVLSPVLKSILICLCHPYCIWIRWNLGFGLVPLVGWQRHGDKAKPLSLGNFKMRQLWVLCIKS